MGKESITKDLTIVITTYNRKEPLLKQLKSIESQGLFDRYEVIISDNHSDYDVKDWVESNLSSDFIKIVRVFVRPFNVGGDANITLSFQIPQTEWMWLLSDDDISEPASIQTILDDIAFHKNDDVCWIKYSISGPFKPNNDITVESITDFFKCFTGEHSAGEMVFMSNNVYRMQDVFNHITDVSSNDITCMTQVLLPLLAVKNEKKKIQLRSIAVSNFIPDRRSYNLIYAYSRFGNLLFIKPLSLNREEIDSFKKLVFFNPRGLSYALISIEDRASRWEYFKRIILTHYGLFSINAFKSLMFYIYRIIKG